MGEWWYTEVSRQRTVASRQQTADSGQWKVEVCGQEHKGCGKDGLYLKLNFLTFIICPFLDQATGLLSQFLTEEEIGPKGSATLAMEIKIMHLIPLDGVLLWLWRAWFCFLFPWRGVLHGLWRARLFNLISMGECSSTWCALVNRGWSMVYTCGILQIYLYFTQLLYTFIHCGWIIIFSRGSLKNILDVTFFMSVIQDIPWILWIQEIQRVL